MMHRMIFKITPRFSQMYLKRIQELFKQQKYTEILGIQNPLQITKQDARQKYITLIKQYHTDGCHNDSLRAAQYQQITKIVIASYDKVSKILFPSKKAQNEEEELICQELFKKSYSQAKYWMHQPGNQKHKEAFYNKLKESANYERKTGYEYRANYSSKSSKEGSQNSGGKLSMGIAIPAFCLIVGSFAVFFDRLTSGKKQKTVENSDVQSKKYKQEDVQRILGEAEKQKRQKAQNMIQSIVKYQPPALLYPKEEPHVLKQLTNYSIAQDIHLYEVPASWYEDEKQKILENGIDRQKMFQMNRIKPNTALTLSLEAERAFQNIYVKVKDVINELQKKGRFTPPTVMFCFHGYVMAEIRDKPLSLRNYRDTDYISIFDLYFDYYSPIFLKKNQFSEYLVNKDDPEYFGWVHFNNRKCNPVYLKANQKIAYFHADRAAQASERYKLTWEGYYNKYQDRWRIGGNQRSRAGV